MPIAYVIPLSIYTHASFHALPSTSISYSCGVSPSNHERRLDKMSTPVDHDPEKTTHISGIADEEAHVPEKVLKHSHDADEALKAFDSEDGEVLELNEETNRRLLRKIDWNLMPVCRHRSQTPWN